MARVNIGKIVTMPVVIRYVRAITGLQLLALGCSTMGLATVGLQG